MASLREGDLPSMPQSSAPIRSHSVPTLPSESKKPGIRHDIKFSQRRFDMTTMPEDIQRVYAKLAKDFGEEYGLLFVFQVRTACELHRAWHMTLLTNKILQQVKDHFGLRMTWNLGVIRLKFRVEDGGFELHRKTPYDYDSEFQDLYMKIAVALVEGHLDIHQALLFQTEVKEGKHTAQSGLFLRTNPGRLILYPAEAATCAVIFFNGDWADAGVAAACGLAAGLVDYGMSFAGAEGAILVDALVGGATGIVGGLFYRHVGDGHCLSSIFLGTLYWFFYGTAFVIGLLEIIAGELETGVTRFIAVSVKTFVLTMGSCIGLQSVSEGSAFDAWLESEKYCGKFDLGEKWWRIPLYLACSVSVLGQYRAPIVNYWRGLIVMLVGYEAQYQMFAYFAESHSRDFLDTAISNITGAMASVITACTVSYIVDQAGYYYSARLLQRSTKKFSRFGNLLYNCAALYIRFTNWLGIGRKTSLDFLRMERKLKQSTQELHDPNHPRTEIQLTPDEEAALREAIVDAECLNIWSLLMPAVYQLVPGSLIARLWYNAVFPPPLIQTERPIAGSELESTDFYSNPAADDVFYGLWVISTSLAVGLLFGFALVSLISNVTSKFADLFCRPADQNEDEAELEKERLDRLRFMQQGVMNTTNQDDPDIVLQRTGTASVIGQDRLERIQAVNKVVCHADPEDGEQAEGLDQDGTEERRLNVSTDF